MTTTPEPTEEGMKFAFVAAATEESAYWDAVTEEEAGRRWDTFLARVRRDAAANALYEVATDIDNYDDYVMVHNRAKRIEETTA